MPNIENCPFCGKRAEVMSFKSGCRVICEGEECVNSAKTVLYLTGTAAIAAWNKRVQPESVVIHHDEDRAMIGFRGMEE